MKLKALDSFYTDETKKVDAKTTFEVESEDFGNELVKRGLAVAEGAETKKEPAPSNKAEKAAPSNKAEK